MNSDLARSQFSSFLLQLCPQLEQTCHVLQYLELSTVSARVHSAPPHGPFSSTLTPSSWFSPSKPPNLCAIITSLRRHPGEPRLD